MVSGGVRTSTHLGIRDVNWCEYSLDQIRKRVSMNYKTFLGNICKVKSLFHPGIQQLFFRIIYDSNFDTAMSVTSVRCWGCLGTEDITWQTSRNLEKSVRLLHSCEAGGMIHGDWTEWIWMIRGDVIWCDQVWFQESKKKSDWMMYQCAYSLTNRSQEYSLQVRLGMFPDNFPFIE